MVHLVDAAEICPKLEAVPNIGGNGQYNADQHDKLYVDFPLVVVQKVPIALSILKDPFFIFLRHFLALLQQQLIIGGCP